MEDFGNEPDATSISDRLVSTSSGKFVDQSAKAIVRFWLGLGDNNLFYRALADEIREAPCFGPTTTTTAPISTRL